MEGVFAQPHVLARAGEGIGLLRRIVNGRSRMKDGADVALTLEYAQRCLSDLGGTGLVSHSALGNGAPITVTGSIADTQQTLTVTN